MEKLNNLAKRYPNLEVIYASDDEGNGYNYVSYEPSIGYFDKEDGEYEAFSNSITTDEEVQLTEDLCNVVCIN